MPTLLPDVMFQWIPVDILVLLAVSLLKHLLECFQTIPCKYAGCKLFHLLIYTLILKSRQTRKLIPFPFRIPQPQSAIRQTRLEDDAREWRAEEFEQQATDGMQDAEGTDHEVVKASKQPWCMQWVNHT